MDSNVYVNNHDIVETYFVRISENKIKSIQKEIDNYYGKGELLEEKNVTNVHSLSQYIGKKIEVVSRKFIDSITTFGNEDNKIYKISYYDYEFYAYEPSQLSKLCNDLIENVYLKEHDRLKLSMTIKSLFDYESVNEDEAKFIEKIMGCIKFEKISPEELIKSDLTSQQKESVFDRIINVIRNKKEQKPVIVVAPISYERDLDKKISSMEDVAQAVNEDNADFKYSEEEVKEIKKNILGSLPTKMQINTKR